MSVDEADEVCTLLPTHINPTEYRILRTAFVNKAKHGWCLVTTFAYRDPAPAQMPLPFPTADWPCPARS
jgi:hypothetical protein